MNVSVCQHSKTRYCKLEERCKRHHESETCFNLGCNVSNCALRHPKICKYLALQDQQTSDTVTHKINNFERQFDALDIEMAGLVKSNIDEKTM